MARWRFSQLLSSRSPLDKALERSRQAMKKWGLLIGWGYLVFIFLFVCLHHCRSSQKRMSGTVETPVAKYGRSSDFGVVLDFIQSMLSNDTLRQTFNIPHLVMVGRQNMAKTTLINRLIGRYLLPMRRNETANTLQARTTYPIILNLRNGRKRMVEVKCDKRPDIGGAVEDPTDDVVEDFLNKVSGQLPKEEGTPISKTPVNVTLQGELIFWKTWFEFVYFHSLLLPNEIPQLDRLTTVTVPRPRTHHSHLGRPSRRPLCQWRPANESRDPTSCAGLHREEHKYHHRDSVRSRGPNRRQCDKPCHAKSRRF